MIAADAIPPSVQYSLEKLQRTAFIVPAIALVSHGCPISAAEINLAGPAFSISDGQTEQ